MQAGRVQVDGVSVEGGRHGISKSIDEYDNIRPIGPTCNSRFCALLPSPIAFQEIGETGRLSTNALDTGLLNGPLPYPPRYIPSCQKDDYPNQLFGYKGKVK